MFRHDQIVAWKQHAIKEYPNESCGYFDQFGEYVPCLNISADKSNDFEIDSSVFVNQNPMAIVHSHPGHENRFPSEADMHSQMSWSIPFGLVTTDGENASEAFFWGDSVKAPALLGREYISGVYDCYTLSRDAYRLLFGIRLPEYPRNPKFWKRDEDLYLQHLDESGFEPVANKYEARIGDGLLFALDSDKINHSGVLIPGTTKGSIVMIHHMMDKISRIAPAGPWLQMAKFVVRWSEWQIDPKLDIMYLDKMLNCGED